MACRLGASSPRAAFFHFQERNQRLALLPQERAAVPVGGVKTWRTRRRRGLRIWVSNSGDSYLDMWKNAVESERKNADFRKIVENSTGDDDDDDDDNSEDLAKKTEEFNRILEVSREERDRAQRMQVIDRAAAAIAAARAIINESESTAEMGSGEPGVGSGGGIVIPQEGNQSGITFLPRSDTSNNGIPGPDFWSWVPPQDGDDFNDLTLATKSSSNPSSSNPFAEKEQSLRYLSIPFESKVSDSNRYPPLPPLQSLMEVEKVASEATLEIPPSKEDHELGVQFVGHAAEAAHALDKVDEASYGVNEDGTRWWKETGIEQRPDGVICRWTMMRGISSDQVTEWQEKFWEASDEFGYKELGSEKSGRNATGNVWREFWRESMRQERGLLHFEKTADKWGKNGDGDEWHEKWWEHYDASGQAEKWAHKWCSIDPNTQLEAGHAHVWHERWGEKYDGRGGSVKYTDKWAERREGDGWTKWGDKWDEHFDTNGHGVKQGETWWAGKYGERWNRTWGERHNGSGWIHKYGKSSSGEHWDTHVRQDTWYEKYPHYGFLHCFENSVQLRAVCRPSEMS